MEVGLQTEEGTVTELGPCRARVYGLLRARCIGKGSRLRGSVEGMKFCFGTLQREGKSAF